MSQRISMFAVRKLSSFSLGAVALLWGTLAAAQTPAETPEQAVVLSPAIQAQVSALAPKTVPTALLRSVKGVVESGSSTSQAVRYFERLDNGLWSSTLELGTKKGIVRKSLMLQGIVPLATVTEIAVELDTTSVVPIGKVFLPFGIKSSVKSGGSTSVNQLSGELEKMMAPAAGVKFPLDYGWDGRVVSTTSGLFGGTKASSLSLSVKQVCTADNELEASTLNPRLLGKYRKVTCDGALSSGATRSEEYAYLVDSDLYVLLSSTINGRTDRYTIAEVEYAR